MLLHAGERRHGLERGPGRVERGGRAVEAGVVRAPGRLVLEQRGELLRVDAADVDRRLVGRVRGHREDRAVTWVEGDDRAAVCSPVVVLVREVDPVHERLLGRPLELHVEGQAEREPGPGLLCRDIGADLPAHGVHADLPEAVPAAELGIV